MRRRQAKKRSRAPRSSARGNALHPPFFHEFGAGLLTLSAYPACPPLDCLALAQLSQLAAFYDDFRGV
jgi:hypothetical protein